MIAEITITRAPEIFRIDGRSERQRAGRLEAFRVVSDEAFDWGSGL